MLERLSVLFLLALALPAASLQQPPAPPAQAPLAAERAEFDVEAVVAEVNAFYAAYWEAWDKRNLDQVADSLAPDFLAATYVASHGIVQLDKAQAVAGARRFFQAVVTQQTFWGRSLLAVVPRSPSEAVAAVRNDFSIYRAGGEAELMIEVLRKGDDGRWRLVRKWSEKSTF